MNSRFLFRGKDADGNWQIGTLVHCGDEKYDIYTGFETFWSIPNPETIGQCTGIKDSDGEMIFEGDIVKDTDGRIFSVKYSEHFHECT
jgi:uncharacterized phage protein (TIGR01671 family)